MIPGALFFSSDVSTLTSLYQCLCTDISVLISLYRRLCRCLSSAVLVQHHRRSGIGVVIDDLCCVARHVHASVRALELIDLPAEG